MQINIRLGFSSSSAALTPLLPHLARPSPSTTLLLLPRLSLATEDVQLEQSLSSFTVARYLQQRWRSYLFFKGSGRFCFTFHLSERVSDEMGQFQGLILFTSLVD
ncbi:hypothetical protein P8452_02895 [Trifolium repens]|nr:hypothetical protein P8452_02895 [Trifolium repens]